MPLLFAVSVLSAGVLGYEILLMRLFSIIQWSHFAYMIISLALLGFGASGTFLALSQGWLLPRFAVAFPAAAAMFGLTSVGGYALAQRLPFNPLEVVWDARQQLYLFELYLILAVPFFCAATCIGMALSRFRERIGRIYRYDLTGAGTGALGVVVALFAFPPADCLRLVGGAGFLAAALGRLAGGSRAARLEALALVAVAVAATLAWPADWLALRVSPYKELSLALRVPDAAVVEERSSPLGLLTIVESPTIPFRHAPGLSLNATTEPPPQLGVFTDANSLTAITRFDGNPEPLAFLDGQSGALPYHLLDRPRVLILGLGGGAGLLRALYHGASAVDAVELNPQMVALVGRTFADFAGRPFDADGVRIHVAEARGFVARADAAYDLIELSLLDSFSAAAAGVYALSESTLYTVEALEAYLRRLNPGGFLAITRWLKLPPRDGLKLFATALRALERSGVSDPARRLALIRSWKTTTLLVKNGAFTNEETAALRAFSEARSFDVAYYPGMPAEEANRYNQLERPYLYEGARALIGPDREAFFDKYKFHVAPATDDRPYFFRFFTWRVLPELLALRGRGGVALVEWGYVILISTLVQAVAASLVLILLPLAALRRRGGELKASRHGLRVVVYFLALGLAFLFVEIAFIQRFALFLSHPLYAIAVVLCGFLVFAGLGSGFAPRLTHLVGERAGPGRPGLALALAVGGIVTAALVYLVLLPPLFDWLRPIPDAGKVAVTLALIAPLGFCMGMPFPLGLTRLAVAAPGWIPWAWGINGCASVASAVLATVLAIHFGFTAVVGLAAGLYVVAALAFARPLARAA
ncbi:MAG: spermidine synthase [Alphaproteobacteria bacterium]